MNRPPDQPPDQPLAAWLVRRLLARDLRRAFRRVCWVGPLPDLPPAAPVVLYANHHNYYDGHLLWLLTHRLLKRPATLWMEDWGRFPLFAPLGVQPFPPGDARRRMRTVRRTARRMRQTPRTVLAHFPEGRLHPPEEGVLPFEDEPLRRLARLLPEARWWPVALHITWRNEARPTALLTSAAPRPAPAEAHARLESCWHALRSEPPADTHLLLEGRAGPSERWNLSWTASLFNRYLS